MFVHAHLGSVGQLGANVEPSAGGGQKLTKEAAKLIHQLLNNSLATLVGSAFLATGGQVDEGYNPQADYWLSKYYVASAAPVDAVKTSLASAPCATCIIVELAAAEANIANSPTDIYVIIAKNAEVAAKLATGSNAVILPSVSAVMTADKKKEGIATMTIVGGLAAGVVGTLVGGPVTGVAAGVGTAALLHYAA